MRQIVRELKMCTKTVSRIITGKKRPTKEKKPSVLAPFLGLIKEWHGRHPSLKATQVYERLKPYGYRGGYGTVRAATRVYRKKREVSHELEFLPGQVAQVDWMEATLPFGKVYGFVFILAYSRYLFVKFYPRSSMGFFLDGHIEACKEIKGIARENWYDNLKSVIIRRQRERTFNAPFLDFARHHGFSIHPCTPGRANEKGRVERVIRDIRAFVEFETNRYSGPADCARTGAPVLACPDHLEIVVNERKVAYHRRSSGSHEEIEHLPTDLRSLIERPMPSMKESIFL